MGVLEEKEEEEEEGGGRIRDVTKAFEAGEG